MLNKENLSWPQNFVQSYVTHKTGETPALGCAAGCCMRVLIEWARMCVCSETGGEAAAAETEQRAEGGVRSPGGTGREPQQDAQSKNTRKCGMKSASDRKGVYKCYSQDVKLKRLTFQAYINCSLKDSEK